MLTKKKNLHINQYSVIMKSNQYACDAFKATSAILIPDGHVLKAGTSWTHHRSLLNSVIGLNKASALHHSQMLLSDEIQRVSKTLLQQIFTTKIRNRINKVLLSL